MATNRVTFDTAEGYTEAWMYLMITGADFKYCHTECWVHPEGESTEEDADTMARLASIHRQEIPASLEGSLARGLATGAVTIL